MSIDLKKNNACYCLLLVEDNPVALLMIEKLVQQISYRYYSARDAETALELIKKHHFDAIITDIGLPGLSGYELAETLRHTVTDSYSTLAIIGLTAHPLDQALEKGLKAGMSTVLSKPINKIILQDVLDELIIKPRASHADHRDET